MQITHSYKSYTQCITMTSPLANTVIVDYKTSKETRSDQQSTNDRKVNCGFEAY